MKKEINPIFALKNPIFRKTVFFDKRKILFIIFLSIFSTLIYSLFPIITQVYVRYLFYQDDLNLLIYTTCFFAFLYLAKLLIDIKVDNYKNKYFAKIEKNIKEQILKKYSGKINKLLFYKKDLIRKDIGLFILLIRTMHNNLLDIIKIIFLGIIIFFFDTSLFLYFLISLPFFSLFYFLIKKEQLKKKEKTNKYENNFEILLQKLSKIKNKEKALKIGLRNIEAELKKKTQSKNSFTKINNTLFSFVSFYRLFYLSYFGYFIITTNINISGLIVGLLFLTLLIKAFNNLLKSIPIYTITTKSFFKINSLMEGEE
jgi:ABC-type bacteriocin/lantibiotic exporter with double-glycine peptidase domain